MSKNAWNLEFGIAMSYSNQMGFDRKANIYSAEII